MAVGGNQAMNIPENKEIPVGFELQECPAYATVPKSLKTSEQFTLQSPTV